MTQLDLLLWGATGFTGQLVAEYLAAHGPPGLLWAIGGRDRGRLEALRQRLGIDIEVVVADALDVAAIEGVARRARVVASTVGPFARYGTPLVEACALHGVDYCDLTAEVGWIRGNIDRLHAVAEKNGARIVHCCGFDSIPSDLGVLMLHEHLREEHGQSLARAALYVAAARGGLSGGTIASLLNLLEQASQDRALRRLLADPYGLNPATERQGPDGRDQSDARFDDAIGKWTAPFLMGPINTRVVRRSNALGGYPYGRDFRYAESMILGSRMPAMTTSFALKAILTAGSFAPTRGLLRLFVPRPGQGPSREKREAGFFKIVLLGESTGPTPIAVRGTVKGQQDPGYAETAKMLAESALCLALDDLPAPGGILTPATCMGLRLIERLRNAGMTFDVSYTERTTTNGAIT